MFKLDNKFKISFFVLIVLTIFLLFEGFFHYYSSKLAFFCFSELKFSEYCGEIYTTHKYQYFDLWKNGFNPLIWNENGIIETFQILLLILTMFKIVQILKSQKIKDYQKYFYYFLLFYLICVVYYFLEEISYGQHYLKWVSNDFFKIYNNQKETNLHNISNLFDQLPRSFLTLWCGLSFVLIKIAKKLRFNEIFLKFILPSDKIKYISYFLLLFLLPDFIGDILNIEINYSKTFHINSADIYNFFTINFIRLSEFHELIFTFYMYQHSIFLKKII